MKGDQGNKLGSLNKKHVHTICSNSLLVAEALRAECMHATALLRNHLAQSGTQRTSTLNAFGEVDVKHASS
jgi:hypothetical protein